MVPPRRSTLKKNRYQRGEEDEERIDVIHPGKGDEDRTDVTQGEKMKIELMWPWERKIKKN